MKVLLLLDVRGVGRRMDVKDVANGYARNFLIPKKIAVPADEKALQIQSAWQSKQKEITSRLEALVKNLGEAHIEFSVRSGPKGEIFGSVKKDDIKAALEEKGFKEGDPILDKPLKNLGVHEVEIDFHHGVTGKVKVILKPSSKNSAEN